MTNRSKTVLLFLSVALILAAGSAVAQLPQQPEPEAAPPVQTDPEPQEVARFGSDLIVEVGERVREAVVIRGDVVIRGEVDRDLVSIVGSATLASTAEVGGDVVVLVGPLKIESGAKVGGDVVAIFGSLDAPSDFSPRGDLVSLVSISEFGPFAAILPWLSDGFLLGRPIVPHLPWVWGFVLVLSAVYLAINFVFEGPVRGCANALSNKPLTTCLAGVLVLLLIGPVSFVLTVSVIGLPAVPFLWCGILVAGLVGRTGVARWIGGRVMPEKAPGNRLEAARSLGIGLAACTLVYMVPVLGFATWTAVGVIGLGAAATTFFDSLRREHSGEHTVRAPSTALAEGKEFPVAGFASRLGAVVLDIILVMIVSALLDLEGGFVAAIFLAYHVALWTWKGTTVGGIICQVRVVRTDGGAVLFTDALVRGLATIFSVAVAGLGWLWILWDADRQAWHDKIAGTFVVRVPPNAPTPSSSAA